jgi:hypothetical protein
MRIKSYFAPSVQSAITLARKEFGEDVTLITSHIAPPESRNLGEYEVVFAIDEPSVDVETEPEPEIVAPASGEFRELLQQAVAAPVSPQLNLPEKLDQLRALFVEIGIEPSMIRALMTMVERCVPSSEPPELLNTATDTPAARLEPPLMETEPPPDALLLRALPEPPPQQQEPPQPVSAAHAQYSAAELAFLSSVSKPAKNAPASTPDWNFGS